MGTLRRIDELLGQVLDARRDREKERRLARVIGRNTDGTLRQQPLDNECELRGGVGAEYTGQILEIGVATPYSQIGAAGVPFGSVFSSAPSMWVQSLSPRSYSRGQSVTVTVDGRGFDDASTFEFLLPDSDTINTGITIADSRLIDASTFELDIVVSTTAAVFDSADLAYGAFAVEPIDGDTSLPNRAVDAYDMLTFLWGFLLDGTTLKAYTWSLLGAYLEARANTLTGYTGDPPAVGSACCLVADAQGLVGSGSLAVRYSSTVIKVWDHDGDTSATFTVASGFQVSPPVPDADWLYWVEAELVSDGGGGLDVRLVRARFDLTGRTVLTSGTITTTAATSSPIWSWIALTATDAYAVIAIEGLGQKVVNIRFPRNGDPISSTQSFNATNLTGLAIDEGDRGKGVFYPTVTGAAVGGAVNSSEEGQVMSLADGSSSSATASSVTGTGQANGSAQATDGMIVLWDLNDGEDPPTCRVGVISGGSFTGWTVEVENQPDSGVPPAVLYLVR